MLDSLFRPKSVAVIGASNRKLTIGYRIIQNLIDTEFNGPIYPVNPKAPFIKNLPAYPTILDIPGEVELAHIVVKNTMVAQVVADCAKKGVKVVIINTGGFKEIGEEGARLEEEVARVGKAAGLRICGPNCQGIMNSDRDVRAYCDFTFTRLVPGHISLVCQSGGVAEVVHNRLYELRAGVRMYASPGNACDISIPEILEYYGNDPETRVVICHIENLARPDEFLRVAKEVSRKKPVLGMKTGRTLAGARAVSSHTGGLIKEDTTTELIFEEAGVVSFHNEEELCQAAFALSRQPIPQGKRVGIITNAGGPGIVSTDEIIEGGCLIPDLTERTRKMLRAALFPEAIVSNPVDVLATAEPKHFQAAVAGLLEDENIDSILLNFITPFFVDCEGAAREIAALAPGAKKPIIAIVMTEKQGWAKTLEIFRAANIPTYDFPESGARALVAMTKYAEYRNRPEEKPAAFPGVNRDAAAKIISEAIRAGREFLPQKKAFELLALYGIGAPQAEEAKDLAGVVAAAKKIGYPVVLKVESDKVVHKSDAGGVALNLPNEAALQEAFAKMAAAFGKDGPSYLVAQQAGAGREVIFGAKQEPKLGPVVLFGLGGIFVEVLHDVAFGLAPLSRGRARQMIEKIKGYPILKGIRGQPPVDLERLTDALCRLGRLVTDHPQILELDLNPVFVYGEGQAPVAVDARIKVR